MYIVMVIAGLLLLPVAYDLFRSPQLRRLAGRNTRRRPTEAMLVVGGAMLGTAIIVSSFVIGDTLDATLTDTARTELGPIDETVITDVTEADAVLSALDPDTLEGVDGVLTLTAAPVVATTTGADPVADPRAWISEADFDDLRGFGAHPDITGFVDAGQTPSPGEVVINDRIASDLGVEVGDTIELHGYGAIETVEVTRVIDQLGIAGWNELWVAPGTIASMFAGAAPGLDPPSSEIIISNDGGLFDSTADAAAISAELESRVGDFESTAVWNVKQERIENAQDTGAEFTTLFSGIGGFSVLAGVLLLVNLFVMLTEERKSELGMLRALGVKRTALARATTMEGAFYALAASLIGAGLGIGIGAVMLQVIEGIFAFDDAGFTMRFSASVAGVATGALIGLVISLVTIWATAGRVARINIIAAIRDLPSARGARRTWILFALTLIGVAGGSMLTFLGIQDVNPTLLLVGPAIGGFSLIPALGRIGYARATTPLVGTLVLTWSVMYTRFFDGIGDRLEINVFVVQGAVLVAAATVIAVSADRAWIKAVNVMGRGVGGRLALAYPLARRVRTGLLLAMYSLVIFTMAFLTAFSSIFTAQTDGFTESTGAGFELIYESNLRTPTDPAALVGTEGVDMVAPLVRRGVEFDMDSHDEPRGWAISGFTEDFLAAGGPKLSDRAAEYGTDLEVMQAVASDPHLIVVNPNLLGEDNTTGAVGGGIGETIIAIDRASGAEVEFDVVGTLDADFLFHGALVSMDSMATLFGSELPTGRYFVSTVPDEDPDLVAGRLNAAFLTNGADARSIQSEVAAELTETTSFLRLMQGFLGLGLVIGIAGLGVVLVRAVRERRREIGMLRALGVPARLVRRAFVMEASFIAIQGIAIGIGLGLVTAYQVVVDSASFGGSDLSFTVSMLGLGIILFVPLIASLLAAIGPAARASRILPAEALRLAD